ncbi:hypothetical protein METBIDRAFT_36921 [Metschnikowia bicuspidata var. bicuspidata NRRL YB-4993]|uniref:PCI domain-containing protein n=1 Tax=Metschnikowia bicuspidata var. bicuspidata NRRL YB-4993 TaxID=869754 RepID=A0A1A0HKZ6_9ASCO|nr:hypothetical protein METBIDRAFT_36921 [Metschnikowia bicuspidata var. bicuspidata NRRL YB-4993]OBA24567.1 hypothetical protein METBIDRAFT_36921 [Metschnikowia bicuspidata var. bicuspidata NRRL YB-4993]
MASVIVVENSLKDSVTEYSLIIDSVRQNTEFSTSLNEYLGDELTNKKELATKILNASTKETLTSLSNKEFEPAFYLLAYLIKELEGLTVDQAFLKDSKIVSLLKECTPTQQLSLRDRKSLRPTTVLSAFNTIFNLLPSTSASRIDTIQSILSIVSETETSFELIQSSIGDNLLDWLEAANASEDQVRQLFWSFISLDKEFTHKSLELIKAFTSRYELSLNELHSLIRFALSSSVVDVSFMVNNNVASALKQNSSDELVKVFVQYTHGEFIASVPASLTEEVVYKSKILALARFFVENKESHQSSFKYNDIPNELVSSPAAFEKLLIDSIKAGVIEGKLNQVEETFCLIRVNRLILAGDDQKLAQDWEVVRNTLLEWKHSLENINEIVANAKDQIVNNNNAN